MILVNKGFQLKRGVLLSDPNEFISENMGFWKGT